MTPPRHSWAPPVRFPLKTERTCQTCGMVRVTRHDAGPGRIPWTEFWHGDHQLADTGATPACIRATGTKRPLTRKRA